MARPNAAAKNPIHRWVAIEAGVVLYYFTGPTRAARWRFRYVRLNRSADSEE